MAEYIYKDLEGLTYSVPVGQRPRKKQPPFVVVMNENCNSCAGSPMCASECPVDCIHMMYDDSTRPMRVYVDASICIGCLNCFSYEIRTRDLNKGDADENMEKFNEMDLRQKAGVCPWDAIEVHRFEPGVERANEFYGQPSASDDEAESVG